MTAAVPSATLVPTNSPVSVGLSFTDAGENDTHTATIDWGDSTTAAGTVAETPGTGTVSGSHSYTAPGTYTVTVTVTDDDGGHGVVDDLDPGQQLPDRRRRVVRTPGPRGQPSRSTARAKTRTPTRSP